MTTPLVYQSLMHVDVTPVPRVSSGLSRVFAAAVVNKQFCDMLLRNPHEALRRGYLGETFSLSKEEQNLLVSIHAKSLSDLANQVNRSLGSQY